MTRLSLEELDQVSDRYDRSVLETADIDHFCSSSHWILPAAKRLHDAPPALIAHEGSAWVLLSGTSHLHPLETMWGLPSPLIGPDPKETADVFVELVRSEARPVVITGLSARSALASAFIERSRNYFTLFRGPVTRRYIGEISAGVDDFLSRRSGDFRKSLKRARRRCAESGVRFEVADTTDVDTSFERILDVERRSWKGMRGVGIDTEPMRSFYEDMNQRLVAREARRLTFAVSEDGKETVAYILGGVLGPTYRGLQFSFDHRYRELSLGNVSQIHEIDRLSRDGIARYDLGTEVRYKKRWADRVVPTEAFILHPR